MNNVRVMRAGDGVGDLLHGHGRLGLHEVDDLDDPAEEGEHEPATAPNVGGLVALHDGYE